MKLADKWKEYKILDMADGQKLEKWPYASPEQWQEKAETLAKLFIDNFDKYTDTPAGAALVEAGPKL